MKMPVLPLVGACLWPLHMHAETPPAAPRLVGIINLPGQKAAWLKIASGRFRGAQWKLREGQRCVDVEVLRISPGTGSVDLRLASANTPVTVSLPQPNRSAGSAAGSVQFEAADLDLVLGLYAECRGRTLLRWPQLPAATFTLAAPAAGPSQVAMALEKALAEKAIVAIRDGQRFLQVVPEAQASSAKPGSSQLRPPPGSGTGPELIPAGEVCFANADLQQVAQVYATLIGRKLDQAQPPLQPTLPIQFKNQTPLTKAECVYALETLFRWQGVQVMPVGDEWARLVQVSNAGK